MLGRVLEQRQIDCLSDYTTPYYGAQDGDDRNSVFFLRCLFRTEQIGRLPPTAHFRKIVRLKTQRTIGVHFYDGSALPRLRSMLFWIWSSSPSSDTKSPYARWALIRKFSICSDVQTNSDAGSSQFNIESYSLLKPSNFLLMLSKSESFASTTAPRPPQAGIRPIIKHEFNRIHRKPALS